MPHISDKNSIFVRARKSGHLSAAALNHSSAPSAQNQQAAPLYQPGFILVLKKGSREKKEGSFSALFAGSIAQRVQDPGCSKPVKRSSNARQKVTFHAFPAGRRSPATSGCLVTAAKAPNLDFLSFVPDEGMEGATKSGDSAL